MGSSPTRLGRMDALFYSTTFTAFGADLWADDPNLKMDGRSHVSLNTPQVYVEVPAALQAVEPIENIVAIEDSDTARDARTRWSASASRGRSRSSGS
jgi:hypothetical protein